MKLSNIKPNPNNPRIIKDEKFDKLVKSLQEFPEMMEKRPMVCVTDVDGKIYPLGGNMRLKALQTIGLKEIPDTWVTMADEWPQEKRREFVIKDNVGFGEWNWEELHADWDVEKLDEWGLDVPGFGEAEQLKAKEDDFNEAPPENPITVLGDLYEIGEHRLLCGDSTDSDQVAKLMNGEKAELLFTSPPYSDMREYNGEKDLSVSNLVEFITSFWQYCQYQVINLGLQRKDNDINEYWNDYIIKARDNGYKFLSWNVWAKPSAGSIGNQSAFFPISHEWIFVFGKKFKDINRTQERSTAIKESRTHRKVRQADGSMKKSTVGFQGVLKEMESVFYSNPELGEIRKEHPATFPIELPSEYIKAMTNEGDFIAEPFTGSGTTMVASHQLKRKCYGMELDPKYCDVIVRRMKKLDSSLKVKRNGIDCTKDFSNE
jgi:DNA modification methylase